MSLCLYLMTKSRRCIRAQSHVRRLWIKWYNNNNSRTVEKKIMSATHAKLTSTWWLCSSFIFQFCSLWDKVIHIEIGTISFRLRRRRRWWWWWLTHFWVFFFLLNSHEIFTRKSPVCFFYQKPSTIEYSTISVDQNSQSSTAKHTKLRSISVEVLFYTSIIHFNADTCFFLFHKFFY